MYLSFPPRGRVPPRPLSRSIPRWLVRFAPSFQIRWHRRNPVLTYDLHRAGGVWFWLLLLVFAWTGVAFNLPAVYQNAMHLFGGSRATPAPLESCIAFRPEPTSAEWRATLVAARRMMAAQSLQRPFRVISERFLSYDRETCRWTYRVLSTLDLDRLGNTQLTWPRNGRAAAIFRSPTGSGRADFLTTWLEALHEAQFGGAPLRLAVFLTGIATAVLSVTGVLLFARKMRRPRPAAARLYAGANKNRSSL